MTKSIFENMTLTKKHKKVLKHVVSDEYIQSVKESDQARKDRFILINNKPSKKLLDTITKVI
jgi:hypothetical protein